MTCNRLIDNDLLSICMNCRCKINEKINLVNGYLFEHGFQNKEEHVVTYDVFEAWGDYSFLLNGVLVRWDETVGILGDIADDVLELLEKTYGDTGSCISLTNPRLDTLSYSFEDFITAFSRLNEEYLYTELARTFSTRMKQKLLSVQYKRDDVNGLFWRINLLRNRAAHSSRGAYTVYNSRAARYMSFGSRANMIDTKDGQMIINTMLIDLEKSDYTKQLIKKEIIEGESDKSVFDLLFPESKPKGHGKKNPIMLYPEGFPFFDLNHSFLSLSKEGLKYALNQVSVFEEEMCNLLAE